MKTSAVLVLAVAFLALVHARVLDHDEMKNIHDDCQANPDTRIDESALRSGYNSPNMGPHTFCMISKSGLMTANGDIQKDILKDYIRKNSHHDVAKVDEIVNDCGKREGATPVEAAIALKNCLRKYEGPNTDTHNHHHHHHHQH
ncbi:uncharacterized protein [Leptinotarsa decemlineata]|uniref:uncharacterized protein n=1 Tax=Leptinotarsa decemlineata TaxID=7539 RepID=UPI003D3092F9